MAALALSPFALARVPRLPRHARFFIVGIAEGIETEVDVEDVHRKSELVRVIFFVELLQHHELCHLYNVLHLLQRLAVEHSDGLLVPAQIMTK